MRQAGWDPASKSYRDNNLPEKPGIKNASTRGKGVSVGQRDMTDIKVQLHGEYGPTLTWRNQDFTSAADLGI